MSDVDKGTGSNAVSQHPAETTALIGAFVFLATRLAGITDPDVMLALGIVFGAVPSMITWLVSKIRDARGVVEVVIPIELAAVVAPAIADPAS